MLLDRNPTKTNKAYVPVYLEEKKDYLGGDVMKDQVLHGNQNVPLEWTAYLERMDHDGARRR